MYLKGHRRQGFSIMVPILWNYLPTDIQLASSLLDFRKTLKSCVFTRGIGSKKLDELVLEGVAYVSVPHLCVLLLLIFGYFCYWRHCSSWSIDLCLGLCSYFEINSNNYKSGLNMISEGKCGDRNTNVKLQL